jgi:hypothetical protein
MATRNRYAEIMAQYAQTQPYSFFGYPESYSGGYDVAQPQAYTAPVSRYEEIMGQQAMSGGGGRGMPSDDGGGFTEPTSQQAYNVSQLGKNLRYVSPLAGLFTSAYGNYLASKVNPNYSNEGRSSTAPMGYSASPTDGGPPPSGERGGGGGGGGASNSNPGDPGRGGGGAHLAKGGYVSMQHLGGPDPEGPDDGYAALKDGEFVINDKAVKKYGIELMQAINSGKISKGKLRGLLEM